MPPPAADRPAATPEPPYYAVIFTTLRAADDGVDYAATAARMEELAAEQPGFLGMESARDGIGITVSYWRDAESIRAWRRQIDHAEAQARGRRDFYERYMVRVAQVERDYAFPG